MDTLPRVSFTLVLERDPIMEGDKADFLGLTGQMMNGWYWSTRTKGIG